MSTFYKILIILLVISVSYACSGDDYPSSSHFNIVKKISAHYFDNEDVPDLSLLNHGQVTLINSQKQLTQFFRTINLTIPEELSNIDFETYSFLFVPGLTNYYAVELSHELNIVRLNSKDLPHFNYNFKEYREKDKRAEDPYTVLSYYGGIITDKIADDSNIYLTYYSYSNSL